MPQTYIPNYGAIPVGPHPGTMALNAGGGTAEALAGLYLKYKHLKDEEARRQDERALRSRELDINQGFRESTAAHLVGQTKFMEAQAKNFQDQRDLEELKLLVGTGDPAAIASWRSRHAAPVASPAPSLGGVSPLAGSSTVAPAQVSVPGETEAQLTARENASMTDLGFNDEHLFKQPFQPPSVALPTEPAPGPVPVFKEQPATAAVAPDPFATELSTAAAGAKSAKGRNDATVTYGNEYITAATSLPHKKILLEKAKLRLKSAVAKGSMEEPEAQAQLDQMTQDYALTSQAAESAYAKLEQMGVDIPVLLQNRHFLGQLGMHDINRADTEKALYKKKKK